MQDRFNKIHPFIKFIIVIIIILLIIISKSLYLLLFLLTLNILLYILTDKNYKIYLKYFINNIPVNIIILLIFLLVNKFSFINLLIFIYKLLNINIILIILSLNINFNDLINIFNYLYLKKHSYTVALYFYSLKYLNIYKCRFNIITLLLYYSNIIKKLDFNLKNKYIIKRQEYNLYSKIILIFFILLLIIDIIKEVIL